MSGTLTDLTWKVILNELKRGEERSGERGGDEESMMGRTDKPIGGHETQRLWRLDEVGTASRIEWIDTERGHI
jgi:hypothetical protein